MDDSKDQKTEGAGPSVRKRNETRDKASTEMPVLPRSNSRSEAKAEAQNTHSETKEKTSSARSESRDRSRSEHSSRSKESPQNVTRSESHDGRSSKTDSRKSDSKRSDSKNSSKSSSTPDKKSNSKSTDTDKKSKAGTSNTETSKEPEHKEPIKVKISLSQIRSYNQIGAGEDSNDSDASIEETVDYERKRGKRKDGSSSKKKRSKEKSRRSRNVQPVDLETLPPPELELMETGDTGVTPSSDLEASGVEPEPPSLPEDMEVDNPTAGSFNEDEDQQQADSGKICSFCACGEKSLLGQGEMCRYDPTAGFNPFRRPVQKSKKSTTESEDRGPERGPKALTSRRQRGPCKRDNDKAPRRGPDDDMCEGFDELATVGFPEDTEMSSVFEPSGHTWAHHCCAAWSEGVIQNEECVLKYVDKAVVSGLSKKCNYCYQYGATINCQRCNKVYHYPCASGGGCFQDIKSLSLLCPDHTEYAQTIAGEEADCNMCNLVGNIAEQLFCTSCGHHYHGSCLIPPVEINPTVRAGWQCPDCKICQMCRQPGDDSKMLVCDMCDKGYHTFCLRPLMTTIPKNGWKCKNCRVCEDCRSRTPGSGRSSRWHLNYTVCDSCYQQRNKGLCCPICGKAYRHFSQKAMVQCNLCKKLVHSECDDTIDPALQQQAKNEEATDYVCPICKFRDSEEMSEFPSGLPQIEDSSDSIDKGMLELESGEESSQHSSQMILNEDSLSSMDVDMSLLGKMSPSYMITGRDGDIGLGKGKLVAIARKKLSLASKTKSRTLSGEKRKRPITFGEKRRGPKPKIHAAICSSSSKKNQDDDDDDDHSNTIILANKSDNFIFDQDVCKSCGSFGKGEEGRLIGCTQCGQCYHPYCASIKVTKIMIQKGWRCLDCTVCEGCGKNHDEGRLLLCDECDISYHTYCLDPPLDHVPKGTWKCKWCVVCLICSSKAPGFGCHWLKNYTHCGPCDSKIACPSCRSKYLEDELVIQCVQCDRWLHAACDGIFNEDDAERAADFGYHCHFCRPKTGQPGPLPYLPPPPVVSETFYIPTFPPPFIREPDPPKYCLMDGIWITQHAKKSLEKTMMEAPKIKRNRRWGKKPDGWDEKRGEIENKIKELVEEKTRVGDGAAPERGTPTLDRLLSIGSMDEDEKEEELKSPDEGPGGSSGVNTEAKLKELEEEAIRRLNEEKKSKKKRNVTKLGVGGFVVKPRFKPKVKKQGSEGGEALEEALSSREFEETMGSFEDEKPKKFQRKMQARRRSQLQESFPSYMQEAFFGGEILGRSRESFKDTLKSLDSDDEKSSLDKILSELPVKEESSIEISAPIKKQLEDLPKTGLHDSLNDKRDSPSNILDDAGDFQLPGSGDQDDGLLGIGDIDDNFIRMIESELAEDGISTELLDDVEETNSQEPENTDQTDPSLDIDDKNVLADFPMMSTLTHIDGKDVEDIFKGVLQDGHEGQGDQAPKPLGSDLGSSIVSPGNTPQSLPGIPSSLPPGHPGLLPSQTLTSGALPSMGPLPSHSLAHRAPQKPPMLRMPSGDGSFPMPHSSQGIPPMSPFPQDMDQARQLPQHSPHFPGFIPAWPESMGDSSGAQDSSRRNMLKWESDEDLGHEATISPILYCNIEHPELKEQYPDWTERSKQIAKIWRKLTPDQKQPYLLKARKNRGNIKAKAKPLPKKTDSMMQGHLPGMPMQPGDVFPSPEGQHSPGGMQSPLRPGSQMVPGTPEGQSPNHPSPGHGVPPFPGSQGDPYHRMPPTPRPSDPYAMPPPTPRPSSGTDINPSHMQQRGPPGHEMFAQSPTGQKLSPGDPYSQPPSTPRPDQHGLPPEQYRSPVRRPEFSPSPGTAHATDPFAQGPVIPRSQQGMGHRPPLQHKSSWPGHDPDGSDRPPPGSYGPGMPRFPGAPGVGMMPRMQRQLSEPVGSAGEDQFQAPNSEHFGVSRSDSTMTSAGDPYARPPGTPLPHMGERFQRPILPIRQQSVPMDVQMMQGGQFRPPIRHPHMGPPGHMMDPYAQQPGTPHPGMEHQMPYPLQQMVDANRRHLPLARMWQHHFAHGMNPDIQKQQLRETLARNSIEKINKKQGVAEGEMLPPGSFPGMRPPRPTLPSFPQAANLGPVEMRKALQEKIKEQATKMGYMSAGTSAPAAPTQIQAQPRGPAPSPSPGVSDEAAQGSKPPATPVSEGQSEDPSKQGEKKAPPARPHKQSLSEDDIKPDDTDELGDFLSADGTFDILKYADPDLDLLGSDNKTIFDDLVEDNSEDPKKKETKEEEKTEVKTETEGEEKSETDKQGFQAKFLEFSQRKPESGESTDSQKAMKTPTTPGGPPTPSDNTALRPGQYPPGVPSPHGVYGQPSPSGLPSPKFMPSPKGQPSPRTPGEPQIAQQQSPFSQHSTHSPFSPQATTPTSAPQSPYSVKTQSPFAVPGANTQAASAMLSQGSPAQPSYSPAHTPPTSFPMQRSPRANVPQQGPPFMQGPFPHQGPMQGVRGGVPPGQAQHAFSQPGMRQQVPPGIRPPTSLQVSQQSPGPQGEQLVSPGIRGMHPRPPFPGHPGSSPGKPGQMYPGMPGMRPGMPGQPTQAMIAQQMMMARGQLPSTTVTATTSVTTTTSSAARPSLLEDQPLLIQDLLEQEKLEQQKRQREQQQAVLRRDGSIRPEGMMSPHPGALPGMVPMGPGMPPRMEGPVRHPGQNPGMFVQPDMPGMRPRMPGQLSPHAQVPQSFGMPPQGQMMPPKPPTPGETGPEAERKHIQYEHWLMKHAEGLEGQIKFLEQQIQKQKRTKKAINARNRQAKKNGLEMPPQDVMELDRASQEQSMLQKQLEQCRKQNRQHQISVQEYRSQQQERYQQQMMAQGQQPQMGPNPITGPTPISSVGMQPPPPRMPGAQGSVRLTPSKRSEYDAYMQSRLQQMGQGMPPRGMPRPPGMPPQPRMAIVDNNPFSDNYQLREIHGNPSTPVGGKPDETPEGGQFRFPAPGSMEGGQPWIQQQQQQQPQRFPFDPAAAGSMGQRMQGPDQQRFPGPFPSPQQQQPPQTFPQTTEVTAASPLDAATNTKLKDKTKKRNKKKKKPPETPQVPTTQAPPGKPAPVTFKPQDETERRIMEILNSTANMQRAHSPASTPSAVLTATTSTATTTTTTAVTTTLPTTSQSEPQTAVSSGQPQTPPTNQSGSRPPSVPLSKTPPVQGRQTPGTHPGIGERLTPIQGTGVNSPNPPTSIQSPLSSTASHLTLPVARPTTSEQLAPSSGPPPSSIMGQGHMQMSRPPGMQAFGARCQLPPGMPPGVSSQGPPGSMPMGLPQRHQLPPGQHMGMQGQTGVYQGQPRGHLGFPPHLRHMRPEMAAQMQQQQLQQQGYQRFEQMQGHPMQRPPVLPHWVAPGTTVPNTSQARRSPRPLGPGMSTMMRMGIPRTRFGTPEQISQQMHQALMSQGMVPTSMHGHAHMPGLVRPMTHELMQEGRIPSPADAKPGEHGLQVGVPSPSQMVKSPLQKDDKEVPVSTVKSETLDPNVSTSSQPVPKINITKEETNQPSLTTVSQVKESSSEKENTEKEDTKADEKKECTDGIHCGTPPPGECTDGIHCGTPPPGECTDGLHCGTPPPGECTDGIHCGTPPPGECTDGIHCGTPPPGECTDGIHCGTPPPGECTDGLHCGTPPPGECTDGLHCGTPPPGECTDGLHCGTPPPGECTDGLHCGTPPPGECADGLHCGTPPPGECTDGIHCGTPPPGECTDGLHCGTPPPGECTDGIHCGTPPPGECTDGIHCGTPPPGECTDGIHCGTPPPGECIDGIHCGTPPPGECTDGLHCGTPPPGECTDGLHCGTPTPGECTDGIHCGTPPPGECTDGLHCGTPPPGECTDGLHCGTPPPGECTDGLHCGTPPPGECTDGLHCGTPPPGECTDGLHCGTPPPGECTDGLHCGTPPPGECTDGIHCGTPPPGECTDGLHCGTPPPGECADGLHCGTPPPGECADGLHCGTPPPGECTDGLHCGTPPPGECTDGLHCGTPPPGECTDGLHCGTPPPGECTDGLHCGTPPPGECTDGLHCGTPPPGECADGLHCGTPPPEECTDGLHCGTPPPGECADGLHCGTPPPGECTDGLHCGTPPPGECTDGTQRGTPPPQEVNQNTTEIEAKPSQGESSSTNQSQASSQEEPMDCSEGAQVETSAESKKSTDNTPPLSRPVDKFPVAQSVPITDHNPERPTPLNVQTEIQDTQSSKPPDSKLLSPQQLAVQADHQYVNIAQSPPAVKPKPVSGDLERGDLSDKAAVLSSITPSNVTITSSPESAFSNPNIPEKVQQSSIQPSGGPGGQSTSLSATDTIVKPPPISTINTPPASTSSKPPTLTLPESISRSEPNVSKQVSVEQPTPSLSASPDTASAVPVPMSTEETKHVDKGLTSTNNQSSIPAQTTLQANSSEKPVTESVVPPQETTLPKIETIKQETSGQENAKETVKAEPVSAFSSCLMESSVTDVKVEDMKPMTTSTTIGTSLDTPSVPSSELSTSAPTTQIPLQLTSVPRPQYFGPIQRYPGEIEADPSRFPHPNRQAYMQGHPQGHPGPGYPGFTRMEMRNRFPAHMMTNTYQQGAPRQFMQQGNPPSSQEQGLQGHPRPGHTDIRHQWRPGMDPRLRLPVQHPRMVDSSSVAKGESGVSQEGSQRYTLHEPEYEGQPGRPFHGHRPDMMPSSSVPSSSPTSSQESRYQLQHPSPDPRYTMPGQQDMRLRGPRIPGNYMQGHPDMRHGFPPGQYPPYFQQRHPGMQQRLMRPEQMMMQRQPMPLGAEQMAQRLPLDHQQGKSSADVKPTLNTSPLASSLNQQGLSVGSTGQLKKPDGAPSEVNLANVKIEPQAPGFSSRPPSVPPGTTPPASQRSTPQPAPSPSAGSQRGTPQPVPSPAQSSQAHQSPSATSQRSSPAQSHSPGRSAVPSPHDDLPSVSATFAAAGMMRLGENVPPGQGPFIGQRTPISNVGSASSGFSSVSSIVQSVSTVSFPSLAGQTTTPASSVGQAPPAEIALPPSTRVKTESVGMASPGSTTPAHGDIPNPTVMSQGPRPQLGVSTSLTNTSMPSTPPTSAPVSMGHGPHIPHSMAPTMPPYQGPPGSMPIPHDQMGNPRMFPSHPGMQPATSAAMQAGPRGKGARQPYGHQGHRFPNMPSNLPPHLAGMLTGMRGPPMSRQPMYPHQQQERHPGMPMAPMRFPPGHPMAGAPGGPRPYPIPHSGSTVPISMPTSSGMMMSPTGRHPGMMHPGMHPGMRHPGGMSPSAPGGPVGHPMRQMHPGQLSPQISPQMSPQMSPTGHPGAPHMHPGIHPTTSGMMGPPGYPQHMGSQPSEMSSPTRHPGAPHTPGSMPSTPSPTPSSFSPGMHAPVSSSMPQTSMPGYHGEMMGSRPQFPYHRMPLPGQRMQYDQRMMYEHHMNPDMHRPPGAMPRFPGDIQHPMMHGKHGPSPPGAVTNPSEEAARQMAMIAAASRGMPRSTPPLPSSASATPPLSGSDTRPSSTSSVPGIKQEPESDLPAGLNPAQNTQLKKLLAMNNAAMAAAMASGQTTPHSDHSEDSNDVSNFQLTPEQRRQLELIEKMPLTTQRTLSENDMVPDLNDPDLEAKRQEYERRRKAIEESRKIKRKNPDGTPKKRKKKKDSTEGLAAAVKPPMMGPGPFQTLGPYDPQNIMDKPSDSGTTSPIQSPDGKEKKKPRMRKQKKDKVVDLENIEMMMETFNQQLKQLPPVPLMEPFVCHSLAICTLAGASPNINGESLVSGGFGKTNLTNDPDFYEALLTGAPTISDKEMAERRKLLTDGKQDLTDEQQRYRLMMENIRSEGGLNASPPFGFASLGMPRGLLPALPPHPRVEPRIHIPKSTDSPESVISSSSPEVGFGEQDNVDYPMLRPIDLPAEDDETRTSPTMPLLQPVPVKYPPFLIKQESQLEAEKPQVEAKDAPIPTHRGKQELDSALLGLAGKDSRMGEIDPLTGLPKPSKDSNADTEVSVTLTLSAKAAEDIGGVLSAIADLLKIAAPPTYEVSRSPSPEQFKSNLKHKDIALNVGSLNKYRSTYCKHCDVAFVNEGIRKKKSELPNLTKEELDSEDEMITFCSQPCLINFKNTRLFTQKMESMDTSDQKPSVKDVGMMSPGEITPSSSTTITPAVTPSSGIEPMETTPTKSGPPTPLLGSPRMKSEFDKLGKSKFRRSGSITEFKPPIKKWKDIKYRRFESGFFSVAHTVEKLEEDEAENWTKLTMSLTHDRVKLKDHRMCVFCEQEGDGDIDGVARLLNMDIDKWAHLNCALWSQDVYETLNGALMNVQQAFKRAAKQKCVLCLKPGASLQCFKSRCNNIYHVPCAQLVGCTFFEDKTIYCPPHSQKGAVLDQVLKSLVVYRKVYINRDEDAQVANMYLQEDGQHTLRIGSLVLHSIGQLLPHQMAGGKFNNRDFLYPVGFKCTRFYWSHKTLYKRSRYTCTIQEKDGRPEFVVTVKEEGQKDVVLQHSTCTGVWKYILEPLEILHKEADLVKIFPMFTSGEELYGLTDPNITRLIESLPGTDLLKDYVFKFGRRQLIDLPLTINPTGCARAEPKLRTHFRKPHTLQSSSTHSLPSTVTSLTGDLNSPYMKHFVHSKSQQYRRLKTEWKNLVYLGRSRIQGLGLYAAKDLEMHTMVIEYIGDLIRNEVANHREKIYEDQNRGVYMFRIDNDTVVDATMAGGPARYINHSCDPNCVAEVVDIDKESKIIIITNRRIQKGEEFTYDYQFDFEDDQHKIPCNCGAHNCRKWMN